VPEVADCEEDQDQVLEAVLLLDTQDDLIRLHVVALERPSRVEPLDVDTRFLDQIIPSAPEEIPHVEAGAVIEPILDGFDVGLQFLSRNRPL
jgi:hypothetical protein